MPALTTAHLAHAQVETVGVLQEGGAVEELRHEFLHIA